MGFSPQSEFLRVMQMRGYVDNCTNSEELDRILLAGPVPAYIGFDATASSLHVGSLIQIMMLRWLQRSGHKPIILMGGGTTKVGDPSFRAKERPLLSEAEIDENLTGIRRVFERFIRFGDGLTDAVMLNNADWLDSLNYLEFLRDIGRHFSVNRMLAFESVKSRLEREQTLSFLEFNYMILQSYDFLVLNREWGCRLQMGGSDQWGNIVNGVDLIRRFEGSSSFGLTTPLLTTAKGDKMGKTADGAVWLNPELRTPYEYWQFWRNTEDADLHRFLLLFTELDAAECERLGNPENPEINEAKAVLADMATELAHGKDAARESRQTAESVFGFGEAGSALPSYDVQKEEIEAGFPVTQALVRTGLAESGKAARRLISGGAVRLNGKAVADTSIMLSSADFEKPAILSASRKRHAVLRLAG
ncbi:MAG: tyrosine--tRNA ligase [Rhodobacteraceae bacterium]|nr:tyrosine--tRNA ligase [Paracoccaceae bacterium]